MINSRLPAVHDGESKFLLSGFGDEISDAFETQLEVMADADLSHIDLRTVEDTNVLDLSADRVRAMNDLLETYGFSVASIGSPVGKVSITGEFSQHLDDFRTAVEIAETFDSDYIRVFSYYIPEKDDPIDWRNEVLDRMQTKTNIAADHGVTLITENERGLYGDTPERCRDILTHVNSPHLRANFDPANFVEIGVEPYPDALLQLIEFVDYLHIKDAAFGDPTRITLPGEGDANIPAILETLNTRGFNGVAALEPHLEQAGSRGGYSGPAGFRSAVQALTTILDDIGASYE